MKRKNKNSCYTYFKITGIFEPDEITQRLQLSPTKQWQVGELRKHGKGQYDFALWEFGRCDDYDVIVENQMMKTITPLLSKINELKAIKKDFDAYLSLVVVPEIYVNEINPCLAPNKEVIKFCYETETEMDIDLYIYK